MTPDLTIKDYLTKLKINFETLEHEPFFSADQGEAYCAAHGFPIPKNLVMTNKRQDQFWMITVCGNKKVNLNQIKKDLGVTGPKFSFATPNFLESVLKVTPGSASPFGLLFDTECRVQWLMDEDFKAHDTFGFHPNLNTQTLKLNANDFQTFLHSLNREVQWVKLPTPNN